MEIIAKSGDLPNRLAQILEELVHLEVTGMATSFMLKESQHSLHYIPLCLQIPRKLIDC